MKLCFSTLGCPDWPWREVVSAAKDMGVEGIEVRCVGNELYAPSSSVFSERELDNTMKRLRETGLCIPAFDSNAVLGIQERAQASMVEAMAYIELAQRTGTRFVRLMCVGVPQPANCDIELCAELYAQLCEYAEDKGVVPLLETNGPLADSKLMRKLMDGVEFENKGVLWDVHHPYRYFGESPAQTLDALGGLIKHVHIKDSELVDGRLRYRIPGKGDLPLKEAILMLRDFGYDGYLSLEWVKKWNPELEEAGIVLPHFVRYCRRVLA